MTITILDGGMGQELVARAGFQPSGLWATEIMMRRPKLVREVHTAYFDAGADVATMNTYAIHHDRLEHHGIPDQFQELHLLAQRQALAARDAAGRGQVACSLGPLGWSYRPDMTPEVTTAAGLYAEIVALHDAHVDLFLAETVSSLDHARGVLTGCEAATKPVWLAMSVDDADGTKLRSGEPVAEALGLLDVFDIAALLINCSVPEAVNQALPELAGSRVPLGAYANGFTHISQDFKEKAASTDMLQKRQDLPPEKYRDFAQGWITQGATIVGGCCEVGPAHIRAISDSLKVAA